MKTADLIRLKDRVYDAVAQRVPRLAPYLHLILFSCGLLGLDLGFRWMFRFAKVVSLANTVKLLPFTFGWVLLFAAVAALLPRLARRIYMAAVGLVYCILCVVHGIYINMFRRFFSFADMVFAGDGAAFMDSSYLVIRKLLLLGVLACFLLILLGVLLVPKQVPGKKVLPAVLVVAAILILIVTRYAILGHSSAIIWNQNEDPAFLYEDFSDSKGSLMMLGIYQYTFRDLQKLIPERSSLSEEERQEIEDFAAGRTHEKNEMSGLLAGKNLLLVQLESIDTWMLEEYMPVLKAVKDRSLVFTNHYTPAYIAAGTFNTEFIANTGLFPGAAGTPVSIYTKNEFPNTLAKLFREAGYTANSFHGSEGDVYNRGAVHENLGFEHYYGGTEMGMANYTFDSHMLTAFDTMTAGDPFFSFLITYSGHGPYSETNPIFLAHKEAAQAEATRTDGNYVYAVGHAKETDLFVKGLMEKLESSGLLENTAVIFYADHYNYYMLDDALNMDIKGVGNYNLLQHTDFFIYSADVEPGTVDKFTSTLDILPTLANLFDLDAQYELLAGDDAFSDAGGYAIFNDNTWAGGEENRTAEILLRRRINDLILTGNYWGAR